MQIEPPISCYQQLLSQRDFLCCSDYQHSCQLNKPKWRAHSTLKSETRYKISSTSATNISAPPNRHGGGWANAAAPVTATSGSPCSSLIDYALYQSETASPFHVQQGNHSARSRRTAKRSLRLAIPPSSQAAFHRTTTPTFSAEKSSSPLAYSNHFDNEKVKEPATSMLQKQKNSSISLIRTIDLSAVPSRLRTRQFKNAPPHPPFPPRNHILPFFNA